MVPKCSNVYANATAACAWSAPKSPTATAATAAGPLVIPAGRSPRRGSPPQRLRHVYGDNNVTKASDQLFTFCPVCADAGVSELHCSARLISTWQNQLLALVTTGWASKQSLRGGEPAYQADQVRRLRVPRLGQLPATPAPTLRHLLNTHSTTPIMDAHPAWGGRVLVTRCCGAVSQTSQPTGTFSALSNQ